MSNISSSFCRVCASCLNAVYGVRNVVINIVRNVRACALYFSLGYLDWIWQVHQLVLLYYQFIHLVVGKTNHIPVNSCQ